ncbi:MAG: demethylmenaquinone methyltransferase-like protein [Sphingomonas bacterium]|uniref:RraA family protein n=1 Tax=Sphingomonas bacterium TaxID=1895847 RepID=UPI00261AA3AA|nr:RraA family protein [Sphingomonas bacterium]MDB5707609.1 demethylmenaquinone methyltransferase-like protein [Sphingomonas bacterium]
MAAATAFSAVAMTAPAHAQIQATPEEIRFYTAEWKGERFPDGRPRVPDALVKRLLDVNTEDAWEILRQAGYNNQFDSGFQMVHADRPFVGRALTVQYLPARPDMGKAISAQGAREKRVGGHNSWPIDMLQVGDVYVADGYGKIADGTLIGDNLGNSIYAKTKTGVVFDASVRDVAGLSQIEGFNAFVRGFDPSFIKEMEMARINGPVRIGRATVLPGDLILAKREGVVFVPAIMAQEVVQRAEFIAMRDGFSHQMLREGRYTPGQIDGRWAPEIDAAFRKWVSEHPETMKMTPAEFEAMMKGVYEH